MQLGKQLFILITYTRTFCGQNSELFNAEAGGT
jgi:hypothetical protein